ncbi:unnamed protein product, partial [marine sediment metagenome]
VISEGVIPGILLACPKETGLFIICRFRSLKLKLKIHI